jgi:hypothetical protein
MEYVIYKTDTGEIIGRGSTTDAQSLEGVRQYGLSPGQDIMIIKEDDLYRVGQGNADGTFRVRVNPDMQDLEDVGDES